MSVFENFEMVNYEIVNNRWIEWYHFGIPNEEGVWRESARIAIEINLKENTFYSGWLVCPEGKLKNTTPFGGWVK